VNRRGLPITSPRPSRTPLDASYVLPIRRNTAGDVTELSAYLETLSQDIEVIVVDGSPPEVFGHHAVFLPEPVRHVAPMLQTLNGKVGGVLTGLALASHERVVIADDDVRYDLVSLARVVALLDGAAVVRPQNCFAPLPWHARWDTARSLINRATGGDWPGTLAVRRSVLERTGGYDGAALFENLELVRTVRAAGGREVVAQDVFVRRLPPTARHFFSQRLRQAYDEFARPPRLLVQLALLPLTALALLKQPRFVPLGALGAVLLAELGRWRHGGGRHFPFTASLMAPLWLGERMVCVWLALASRLLFGGVRYSGKVVRRAANPSKELARRYSPRAVEVA
jgi:hypothetical protein